MTRFLVSGVAAAALLTLGLPASAQDADAGKKVFARCMPCHNVDKPQNKVGPSLLGLFGRTAGTVSGFNYSNANKESGVVWSAETLDPYLKDPKVYIPGNKMPFPGVKNDTERANLIAYLAVATKVQ